MRYPVDVAPMECCGVQELNNIGEYATDHDQFLRDLQESISGVDEPPFYIFTEAYARRTLRKTYGMKLEDYILKHKLGTVIHTEGRRNPNTGNLVRVYTWTVDWKALYKRWELLKVDEEDDA